MMKKLLFAFVAGSLLLVPMAMGQDEIVALGSTAPGSFVFTGTGTTTAADLTTGSDWSLSVVGNPCPVGQCGELVTFGPLSGTSGFYSLNTAGVTLAGAFQGVSAGANEWTITQNKPIGFNGSLLSGNLQLVSLDETGKLGHINDNFIANLTITGGTLASFFTAAGGVLTLDFKLGPANDLLSLGVGKTLGTAVADGQISNTPEPGSMVLLGSGLLAVGGYLRRRVAGV